MTRGKWVLLQGLLGPMGMFCLVFWVDAGSLSGLDSANERESFGVCAILCSFNPVVQPCEVFCTSRRQSSIQSNIIVTGEKDSLVKDIGIGVVDGARSEYACPFSTCLPSICDCRSSGAKIDQELFLHRAEVRSHELPVSSKKPCDVISEDNEYLRLIFGCRNARRFASTCCSTEWTEEPEEFSEEVEKTSRFPEMENPRDEDALASNFARGPYVADISDAMIEERDEIDDDFDFLGPGEDDQFAQKSVHFEGREGSNGINVNGFDWEKFCEIQCGRGNGGAACRCDIIP